MRVVVVSPHLDDAVLSIGATLHALCRRGVDVRVVTIFAGDPDRTTEPSCWDSERGVETAAEATALRRKEDLEAAAVIGYEPVWLGFDDSGYVYHRDPDAILAAVRPHIDDADLILVPGWPLVHMDHRYVSMLMIERVTDTPISLYSELPYAATPRNLVKARLRGRTTTPLRAPLGGEPTWSAAGTTRADRSAKREAVGCYLGEVKALGYRAVLATAYDRVVARELLAALPGHPLPPEFYFD